jgi:methionyl-tRNA formyltransferase
MRVAIIGQQAFGKAALEAFIDRGHTVAAVFVAPEKPGARPDPLKQAATERQLPVHSFASYSAEDARATLRGLDADLGIMAYVTQFIPEAFCAIPKHGTIQFHPSLLPLHRGPSSINWAIIQGRTKTGLTIFRPTEGLDEGPVLLQKEVTIGPDDTIGSVYFDKIFPAGVAALIETAESVLGGTARERVQDESLATYEGWVREAEAQIDWAKHVDRIYDLVRGCNPAPGAWTRWEGRKLQIFDARKIIARRFADVRGLKLGQVTRLGPESFCVHGQGGFIEVLRCRVDDGQKIKGAEAGIADGTILGG